MPFESDHTPQTAEQKSLALAFNDQMEENVDDAVVERCTNLRQAASKLFAALLLNCPAGADRSAAVRKIREGLMTANASILMPPVKI